jgi:hypothetical protein
VTLKGLLINPTLLSKSLALFRRVVTRYGRPGQRADWPPLRLFYLPWPRPAEGVTSREPATVFHVIQQPVPWPRAFAACVSSSATRFVERVVARVGRVAEKVASPVTGAAELVYVVGARSSPAMAGSRAAAALEAASHRAAELRTVYRTPGTAPEALGSYPVPGPSIYYPGPGARTAPGDRAAPAAAAAPAAEGGVLGAGAFPELVHGPPPAVVPDETPSVAARAGNGPAYPAARFVDDGTAPERADGAAAANYQEITANLDFDYLGERLFKMFERANRIAMERRGLM